MQRRYTNAHNSARQRRKPAYQSIAIVVPLLIAPSGFSAEALHLNWRQPQQIVRLESLEVGDMPEHIISIGESRGKAIFKNGEVATVTFKYMADYTRGAGPFQAYSMITFKDHSRIFAKYRAFTTATPNGKTSSFKGKFTFLKGTGRFRGIRGSGYCAGQRSTIHGHGAKLYLNNFSSYTLTER